MLKVAGRKSGFSLDLYFSSSVGLFDLLVSTLRLAKGFLLVLYLLFPEHLGSLRSVERRNFQPSAIFVVHYVYFLEWLVLSMLFPFPLAFLSRTLRIPLFVQVDEYAVICEI